MQKTEKPGEFRNKDMKPRITINEVTQELPQVILWRRFGCGGWFLVQTADQASDRRNHRFAQLLLAQEIRRIVLESQTLVPTFTP